MLEKRKKESFFFSPTLGPNGDYLRKFVGKLVSWPTQREREKVFIDIGDQQKEKKSFYVPRFIEKD